MIPAQRIRSFFDLHTPALVSEPSLKRAEVALVLNLASDQEDPDILFIQRAEHKDDPWSGQMAFPGGRREPQDQWDGAAACRETHEEIGLELSPSQMVGRLDDMRGRHGGRSADLVISCFVFMADEVRAFRPNHEVSDVVSLPLSRLLDPTLRTTVRYDAAGDLAFPGVLLDSEDPRVIWGLTYRFLTNFFSHFGLHLPAMPR
ncbi:MAG: NUDIX hydrolase [Arenicellales bacterium]